ncbi:MAG: hypothetical protein OSB83_05540 [Planctomycetota bacterium]|nr:hypothetical protein [Planctomycetota bacterium]
MNQKQPGKASYLLMNPAIPSAPENSVVTGFYRKTKSRKALLALLILCVSGCNDWRGTDTVEVLSEKPSPDGRFIAASFYCEGGGAAGYCYWNASLRRAGEQLNQRDGLLGKHKTWMGFSDIELRWIDDSNLEVSYRQDTRPAYREQNSVRVESRHGTRIHYIVTN